MSHFEQVAASILTVIHSTYLPTCSFRRCLLFIVATIEMMAMTVMIMMTISTTRTCAGCGPMTACLLLLECSAVCLALQQMGSDDDDDE